MVAFNALGLQIQYSLAIVAVSVRSVVNLSHLSSFKHELVPLLKASLNPILIKVVRYVALILYIVDFIQDVE